MLRNMETESSALAPDPTGLDQLLIDIKNEPMEQHALQQQAVLAFGRRTNAQPPLPVLLQDAVALVGEVLHAELGGVGEVRDDTLVLTVMGRDEGPGAQEHRCPLADVHSMAAFALRSGNVTVTADLREETRFRDDYLRSRDVVGAVTVPLHVNGKPFGVLGVYTHAPRQFSSDDVTFAETIAHLLGASVARIKAEQKLQEARRNQVEPVGHGGLDGHDARHGRPSRRHEPCLRRADQVPLGRSPRSAVLASHGGARRRRSREGHFREFPRQPDPQRI